MGLAAGPNPAAGARTVRFGDATYRVTPPNLRDPRLHVAAVIVTVHVLGQVVLRFQVSVPQILAAILTCAAMELVLTFRATREIVWPASAMLTGSGVALILRVPSTPPGDHWTFHRWYVFAGVAGFSLLTKYVIRYRGAHVFNPSNVGLVVVFLLFGSATLEPLDFWWAPLDAGMIAAYAVILIGGTLIARRLGFLEAVLTFWVVFAVSTGLLAATGHCMVARWAFAPVCGFDFWRVVVTSPEVLIFLFFMLTDPKTVPSGRVERMVFSAVVALVATVLIAPQTNEYGTKVALLGSLTLLCAARPVFDRVVSLHPLPRVALATAVLVVGGTGIVAAGAPARQVTAPSIADVAGRVVEHVDPGTLPTVTIAQDVVDWNHEITGAGAQQIVLSLAEDLAIERQALLAGDAALLAAADHGDRLDELRRRIEDTIAGSSRAVEQYRIDEVHIVLVVPFGRQAGLSLGLESRGTVTTEVRAADGTLDTTTSAPFETTFVVGRPTGGRWLIVAVEPSTEGGRP